MTDQPSAAPRPVIIRQSRPVVVGLVILALGVVGIVVIALVVTFTNYGNVKAQNEDLQDTVEDLRGQVRNLKAQNTELQTTVDDQSAVSLCRSRAALDSDAASLEVLIAEAEGLAALGRGESLAPFVDDLLASIASARTAIDVRDRD